MNMMFSATFPPYHPRTGQETDFVAKILRGEKRHTVRKNIAHWIDYDDKRVMLCTWAGKPYRRGSRPVPFATAVLRVKMIDRFWGHGNFRRIAVLGKICEETAYYNIDNFAHEDGLSVDDFTAWFHYDLHGIICHACIWLDDVQPFKESAK